MDIAPLVPALEAACAALGGPQHHQAEVRLQELSQTPYPQILQLAQLAWQQSQSTPVLFNAGVLLKRSVVRDWGHFDASARLHLHQFLVQTLVDRHHHLEKAALFQLIHGLCLLHKLWWSATYDETKGPENLPLLQSVLEQFYGTETLEGKRVGVELALNLVWEFSNVFSRSTELGLPWEAHELCRLNFQERVLPGLLRQTAALLAALAQHRALRRFPPLPAACLNVLTHALGWNFDAFSTNRAMTYHGRDEASILTPPADWADFLLAEGFGQMLLQVQREADDQVAALVSPILLQLASLNGKIFGSDSGVAKAQKGAHFDRVIRLLFAVMTDASHAPADDGDAAARLANACQTYARLVAAIEPEVGFFASAEYEQNCTKTYQLTIHIMQKLSSDPTNPSLIESLDALLEVWVALVTSNFCTLAHQKFGNVTNQHPDERKVQHLLRAAGELVDQFTRFRLESHGLLGDDEADPDHDREYHSSQLANVAQLGRVSPAATLAALAHRLQAAVSHCEASAGQASTSSAALEHAQDTILFALQLGMCILTDEGEGEQAQIPDPIIRMGQQHERLPNAEERDECCLFLRAALAYAARESAWLGGGRPQLVSPLVCKQLLQFLTRYVQSYLLPDTEEYPDFCVTYSTCFNHGHDIVEACIEKALTCLRSLGQEELIQQHAPTLLLAVVKRKGVARFLPASAAWRQLTEAERAGSFAHLPGACRRSIFEVLCIGYGSHGAEDLLLLPLHQHFTALLQQPRFQERCQSEEVRREVDADLERIRAVSRAGLSSRDQAQRTYRFVASTNLLTALLSLAALYSTRHDILLLIVRCFDDLVVTQNMYSTDEETGYICSKCMELLQAYATWYNASKVKNAVPVEGSPKLLRSPVKAESLSALEEDEELETLQALLDLLVHITQWDMLDFSGEPGGRKFDVGGACFTGFGLVLRLVTDTTLQYPAVCTQFFNLLLHLVEVYPDYLAKLDDGMFQVILQAIAYAVDNASLTISKFGFRAIAAIALYHYGTQCTSPLAHKLQDNFFSEMCLKVLRLCVDCFFDAALLPSVGQACWALFCVLQQRVTALLEACLAGHPQAPRVRAAFQTLVTAEDLQFNNGHKRHKAAFLNHFEAFVAAMRALRTR